MTLGEVVETSARLLSRDVRIVETNPAQPSIRNADNTKARAQLGWRPTVELADGLRGLHRFLESN